MEIEARLEAGANCILMSLPSSRVKGRSCSIGLRHGLLIRASCSCRTKGERVNASMEATEGNSCGAAVELAINIHEQPATSIGVTGEASVAANRLLLRGEYRLRY